METKIVGYKSKAGNVRAYRQIGRAKSKFGEGYRVHLQSFGENAVDFWVDEGLLVDPPPPRDETEVEWEKAEKKTCWECGRQFTWKESKRDGGEWSEDYCGC